MFDLDFLDTYENDDDDNLVLYCTENDDGTCHFILGKREAEKDDDDVNDSLSDGHQEDEGDYDDDDDNEGELQEIERDEKEEDMQLEEGEVEKEEEQQEEEEHQFHIQFGDEPAPDDDEEISLNFTNINGSDVHMRFLLHVPPEDTEAYILRWRRGSPRSSRGWYLP